MLWNEEKGEQDMDMGAEAVSYLDLEVGDRVGSRSDRGAIFTPGPSRWYALRVRPQREDQAEAWLSLRGVYGFHPVLMRKVSRAGRIREYARRYLPGYVFARFPGDPLVHAVLTCPFITGALTLQGGSGEWGILEPRKLQAIYSMRKLDAQAMAARAADRVRRKAMAAIRTGDSVLFKAGVFSGFPSEVVELRADGDVRVRLRIFGRETLALAKVDDLVRVHKPVDLTQLP